jgi:hypothetical protein
MLTNIINANLFKTALCLLLITIIFNSCQKKASVNNGNKVPDSLKMLKDAKELIRTDSIAKNLSAIRFSTLAYSNFSVNIDTILNRKILLQDFSLIDIQKKGGQYYAKLSAYHSHYLFKLQLKLEDVKQLRINENDIDTTHFLLIEINNIYMANEDIAKEFYKKGKNTTGSADEDVPFDSMFKLDGKLIRVIKRRH